MPRFTIAVDDLDASEAPDSPWTATVTNDTGDVVAVGIGRTADAVRDAAANPWDE